MAAQSHRSDPRILRRRTLQRDHRGLAELLRPGMSVLDIGCGAGSITAGIARAVGPQGRVVGIDRDETLLEMACAEHGMISNLHFESGDANTMRYFAEFDIVTASRTLQWIAEPAGAVSKMGQAVKPSGLVVVLDYNHFANAWQPDPPQEFMGFYRAFLDWREANGWDNAIADHLPALLESSGLAEVRSQAQDEIVERGDADFTERTALWSEVIENVGSQLVVGRFCTDAELSRAHEFYRSWTHKELKKQVLAMRTVTGRAPDVEDILDPFTGKWRFNAELSKLTTPPPRSWFQEISASADDVAVCEHIVTSDGSETRVSVHARFDGNDYPVAGSPIADTISYTRPDPARIFGAGKKNGLTSLQETLVVAPGRNTLTITYSIHAGGKVVAEGAAVFQRDS